MLSYHVFQSRFNSSLAPPVSVLNFPSVPRLGLRVVRGFFLSQISGWANQRTEGVAENNDVEVVSQFELKQSPSMESLCTLY